MNTVTVGDVLVAYTESGLAESDFPPVVFVHGLGEDRRSWAGAQALSLIHI